MIAAQHPPLTPGQVIAIGSNIDPETNIPRILWRLLDHFAPLYLSRILRTDPVGIHSRAQFLNLAVFISTEHSVAQLKTLTNTIETRLGRDRADPGHSRKDRPADLDILFAIHPGKPPSLYFEGNYQRTVVLDLLAWLGLNPPPPQLPPGITLNLGGVSAGEMPATINRDRRTGHVIIVEHGA